MNTTNNQPTEIRLRLQLSPFNIERVCSLRKQGASSQEIADALDFQRYTVDCILGGRITLSVTTDGVYDCVPSTMHNNPMPPAPIDNRYYQPNNEPIAALPSATFGGDTLRLAFASHPLHRFVETSTITLDTLARRVLHGTEKPKKLLDKRRMVG